MAEPNDEVTKQEKARKLFDNVEVALAFVTIYVQVQTTWAVLILAFLAGLLAELGVLRLTNLALPFLVAPIILYQLLLAGLCISTDRFLTATSVVERGKKLFREKHGEPIGWKLWEIFESWLFKNGDIRRMVELVLIVLAIILFELTLLVL